MTFINNHLKVPGISLWVTVYLFIVIAFGVVLGIPALFGNGLLDAHTIGWGGRELCIGIGAIIAAVMRNAVAYMLIFIIGLFRELSDMFEALDETPSNTTSAVQVGIFLAIGAVCAWFSYVAVRRERAAEG